MPIENNPTYLPSVEPIYFLWAIQYSTVCILKYNERMTHMPYPDESILKNNIAKNIARYRKENKLTQAELAEKLNYSDKSISKWERGDGIPDVYVLTVIADLFGVTVNDLVYDMEDLKVRSETASGDSPSADPSGDSGSSEKNKKPKFRQHLIITLLAIGIVWLVATIAFVILSLALPSKDIHWIAFIFALPVSSIVALVFSKLWFGIIPRFISVSAINWTVALSIQLCVSALLGRSVENLYLIYIASASFEILVVLWYILVGRNYWSALFEKLKENKQAK